MSTTMLAVIVLSVIVLIVIAIYVRMSFSYYFAVMESYDIMSFEWQFEEAVIERILNHEKGHLKDFIDSKMLHTIFTCMSTESIPLRTYKEGLVRDVILPIMDEDKLVEYVTYLLVAEELQARWHHVEGLTPEHQERYIQFMSIEEKRKRMKKTPSLIEVSLVRKLPKGKKNPPGPKQTYEFDPAFQHA